MASLYYAEHVHIAWIQIRIPTPYFCIVQESVFESGNVIKSLRFLLKSGVPEIQYTIMLKLQYMMEKINMALG